MAEWHLEELEAALAKHGWRLHTELPGDGYQISASWQLRRSDDHKLILPIFQESSYEVDNFCVVPAWEAIVYTGSAHKQLQDLPEGAQVIVRVVS